MSTQTKTYAPGTFCWVDLSTTNLKSATRFYSGLFGWTVREVGDEKNPYTLFLKKGLEVAGLMQQGKEQIDRGVPPHWMNYVCVENVDSSVQKAERLGATTLLPAMDAMQAGRMAILRDPTGAVLGLWQPLQHQGAQLIREPGSVCWNELMSPDIVKASAFYAGLFSWAAKDESMGGGMTYTLFSLGDGQVGGGMKWEQAFWLPYFAVENCDGTAARVGELGGKVKKAPQDIPDVGRFAVAMDPQGAGFAFLQPVRR